MGSVVLANDDLSVVLTPDTGCDLRQITSRRRGYHVLSTTPWTTQPAVPGMPADDSVASWLRRYPGGWQLLLPNAGDPCTVDGVSHGFHGEASMARWESEFGDSWLRGHLACFGLPLRIERHVTLDGPVVTVADEVTNSGPDPVTFMWGHHPGFGADLLAGGATIDISGRRVRADDRYDPPGNALRPGATSPWPTALGRGAVSVDLTRPQYGHSLFACVDDLVEGRARIIRDDEAIGVELRWDASVFPCVWLWEELGGTRTSPWFGRGSVVGIEPFSTWPGQGLAHAIDAGAPVVVLAPGETRSGWVTLEVLTPND